MPEGLSFLQMYHSSSANSVFLPVRTDGRDTSHMEQLRGLPAREIPSQLVAMSVAAQPPALFLPARSAILETPVVITAAMGEHIILAARLLPILALLL